MYMYIWMYSGLYHHVRYFKQTMKLSGVGDFTATTAIHISPTSPSQPQSPPPDQQQHRIIFSIAFIISNSYANANQ